MCCSPGDDADFVCPSLSWNDALFSMDDIDSGGGGTRRKTQRFTRTLGRACGCCGCRPRCRSSRQLSFLSPACVSFARCALLRAALRCHKDAPASSCGFAFSAKNAACVAAWRRFFARFCVFAAVLLAPGVPWLVCGSAYPTSATTHSAHTAGRATSTSSVIARGHAALHTLTTDALPGVYYLSLTPGAICPQYLLCLSGVVSWNGWLTYSLAESENAAVLLNGWRPPLPCCGRSHPAYIRAISGCCLVFYSGVRGATCVLPMPLLRFSLKPTWPAWLLTLPALVFLCSLCAGS